VCVCVCLQGLGDRVRVSHHMQAHVLLHRLFNSGSFLPHMRRYPAATEHAMCAMVSGLVSGRTVHDLARALCLDRFLAVNAADQVPPACSALANGQGSPTSSRRAVVTPLLSGVQGPHRWSRPQQSGGCQVASRAHVARECRTLTARWPVYNMKAGLRPQHTMQLYMYSKRHGAPARHEPEQGSSARAHGPCAAARSTRMAA
jgi:hypothetical protein